MIEVQLWLDKLLVSRTFRRAPMSSRSTIFLLDGTTCTVMMFELFSKRNPTIEVASNTFKTTVQCVFIIALQDVAVLMAM